MKDSNFIKPQLFKERYPLDKKKLKTIQWISTMKINWVIKWIVIYAMDGCNPLCCPSICVHQQDFAGFLYFDTDTLFSFLFYKWYQTKILCQRWMNICRLRYKLLVRPHLNSLPILMSYTQGTVLHWKRIYSTHSRYTLYGFLLSSLSQLLHSKNKKKLKLVALIGTLLVQALVFGGANNPVNGFEGTYDAFARDSKTKYNNRIKIL